MKGAAKMAFRTIAVLAVIGLLAGGTMGWAQVATAAATDAVPEGGVAQAAGENLTFGGVGLVVSAQQGDAGLMMKVVGMTEDSPAVAAGVQVGDQISHISEARRSPA